jgi:predicted nuclease of predicted toxin-antitoxin system
MTASARRAAVASTAEDPVFASMPDNIPRTVEIDVAEHSFDYSERGSVFKVVDQNGNTHRIRADSKLESLFEALLPKLGKTVGPDDVTIHFVDDEGDAVLITTDDDLAEAVNLARGSGNQIVKLTVSLKKKGIDVVASPAVLAAIGAIIVGVVALGAMIALKPRK